MELTVVAAVGEAEIDLARCPDSATVGDVLHRVTGVEPPGVVSVDGRAVPAATLISAAALTVGTVLDVAPASTRRSDGPIIVQIAGPGAGRRGRLRPGRFDIGKARRPNSVPLSDGDVIAAELHVEVDNAGTVQVRSDTGLLDGASIVEPRPWRDERLRVGDRVFRLQTDEAGQRLATDRLAASPPEHGRVPVNRPPRHAPVPPPSPLIVPQAARRQGRARWLLSWEVLAPVPVAIVLAVVVGPRALLVAVMSPVIAVFDWFATRHPGDRAAARAALGHLSTTGDEVAAVDGDRRAATPRGGRSARALFELRLAERHGVDLMRARERGLDLAEAVRRATEHSALIWERRPNDPDAFVLGLGVADRPWQPSLAVTDPNSLDVAPLLVACGPLHSVSVDVDLQQQRGVGFVGDSRTTRAAMRALMLQAAVAHGPADLDIVVLASEETAVHWEWVKWLPQARGSGTPQILADAATIDSWVATRATRSAGSRRHVTLVVADDPRLWTGRTAPLRSIFADTSAPVRFLAAVEAAADVPAVCTTILRLDLPGGASAEYPTDGSSVNGVAPFLLDVDLATVAARRLARFDDPEVPATHGSALPSRVPFLPVLGFNTATAERIVEQWNDEDLADHTSASFAIGEVGAIEIDLATHGPHALIAGASGSGKSELLRTLVAGLATSKPPDALNVILIDLGSAGSFGACTDLPHVVGTVTAIDEHEAYRLARSLRAEVARREGVLRAANVAAFDLYHAGPDRAPLPRLVIVLDEFADLLVAVPGFVPELIDIARQGRTAGIHLIMATRRTSKAVDNHIKANTNLRIALALHDADESIDIIGTGDAAHLPRQLPGRGYIRSGVGNPMLFQSAHSDGVTPVAEMDQLDVAPFVLMRPFSPLEHRLAAPPLTSFGPADNDLVAIVGAVRDAARLAEQPTPAPPHIAQLPATLERDALVAMPRGSAPGALVGLADLPDAQAQEPWRWDPGRDGNLLVLGSARSGRTSLLAELALSCADDYAGDELHLYVVDAGRAELGALEQLPVCGGVAVIEDLDRLDRMVRHVQTEVERRRAMALTDGGTQRVRAAQPRVVLLIDDVAALRCALEQRTDLDGLLDDLEVVLRDGPAHGISTVVTAASIEELPDSVHATFERRLVLRLDDATAYAALDVAVAEVPSSAPGRALLLPAHTEMQLIAPAGDLTAAVDARAWPRVADGPVVIRALPQRITINEIGGRAPFGSLLWTFPVGLDTRTLDPATLHVRPGEAALVAGPPESGRSTALANLACVALTSAPHVDVYICAPRGGPLSDVRGVAGSASVTDLDYWSGRILHSYDRFRLVLIDDAGDVSGPAVQHLATSRDDRLVVIAAGRSEELKAHNHWTRGLQRSRTGLLLRPTSADAELLHLQLGTRLPRFGPHRGILVNGGAPTAVVFAEPAVRTGAST